MFFPLVIKYVTAQHLSPVHENTMCLPVVVSVGKTAAHNLSKLTLDHTVYVKCSKCHISFFLQGFFSSMGVFHTTVIVSDDRQGKRHIYPT